MLEQGYFQGCSLERSSSEYDKSVRLVCKELGIQLVDVPDWSCCGVHAAQHVNPKLSAALGARNLSLAIDSGIHSVMAPCPSCYNRLKLAQSEMDKDVALREEFKSEFEFQYDPQMEVISILEFMVRQSPEKIKAKVKRDLSKLKLVTYYGCLLVRPPKLVCFDDPEDPVSMDELLRLVGVDVLPWDYKVQCCGASLAISDPKIHTRLSGEILGLAKDAGAVALAVACPLCHVNLDLKQEQINRRLKAHFNLPVFYFTQLLGLAFGAGPEVLGIDKHMVDAMPLLAELGVR